MAKHNWNSNQLLVDYAIKQALSLGLEISLTILWDQADWPIEGLQEFKSKYYEWIDAFNRNEKDVLELIKAMKDKTGIEA